MGFMTLDQFRNELQSSLGERTFDNDRLNIWVNSAYLDIASSVDFARFDNTSTGSTSNREVSLPANIMVVKFVSVQNQLLGYVPQAEAFRRRSESGTPVKWTRSQNNVILVPSPASSVSYEIMYKTTPSRLTSAGSTTDIPDFWDLAVQLLSVHHALLALGEEERAMTWYQRAIQYIQTRMSEDILHMREGTLAPTFAPNLTQLAGMQAQGGQSG
jgi:hypothetical protein